MMDSEQAAINRRQRIAEMLMAQGQAPIEQQEAGGYVVPISPLSGLSKVAQQLAGAYVGRKADDMQGELAKKRMEELSASMQDDNIDYSRLANAGVSTDAIAKAVMDQKTRERELQLKRQEKEYESTLPTNDMRNAKWAAGGNEEMARELVANKLQNPLGYLNYQLQANNAAANQDIQRQGLDLRRQEVERKQQPSEFQQWTMQQKQEKEQLAQAEKEKQVAQASLDAQNVLDQAEKLYNHPGRLAATGMSSPSAYIPWTDSANFVVELDTFKAKTFVPMVQALKGMGALSDAEGKRLSESVGALNQKTMSEEAIANSLKDITNYLYKKAAISGLKVKIPKFADDGISIDVGNITPEEKAAIQADIEKNQSGVLTPEEQAELEQLRKRFGK